MAESGSDALVVGRRAILINVALGLSTFLTLFDVTAVVVAMPAVAKDLGFGIAGMAWLIDTYSLAFTASLLTSGALADRFGRLRCLLTGNAMFLAASLLCGAAWTGPLLLAARVLQGVGAAFMTTGAIALLAHAFPNGEQRTRAFGINGVISGVAMALGPTLGGALAAWFGWRWVFFANIPICVALALAVPRLVAETHRSAERRIDPVGVALLTISLGLIVNALLMHDGSASVRVACLIGGTMAACLFGWRQTRHPHPVFDPRVFATPIVVGACVLIVAIQFSYWALLVYLPLFLSVGLHASLDMAGVTLLAATLPMLLVPLIGGHLAVRWGWRQLFVLAFVLMATGDAFLVTAALSGTTAIRMAMAVVGMVLTGTGAALANPQMSGVVLAHVPPAQYGMASAMTMITRQAGFVISIASLGAALGTTEGADGFAKPFVFSAAVALLGVFAALVLLPGSSVDTKRPPGGS